MQNINRTETEYLMKWLFGGVAPRDKLEGKTLEGKYINKSDMKYCTYYALHYILTNHSMIFSPYLF